MNRPELPRALRLHGLAPLSAVRSQVSREELWSDNPENPVVAAGTEVEFLVAKDGERFCACAVTLPSSVPLPKLEKLPKPEKPPQEKKAKPTPSTYHKRT